jgi:3-hydroxybutyryl-CoA dehydrogenase
MKGKSTMNIEDIRRVLVIGAGTMGQEIGFISAVYGYHVTIYDIDPKMLEVAIQVVRSYAGQLVNDGRLTADESDGVLRRIATTTNPKDAAEEADLISESVPENPKLKGQVFAQFNTLCPKRTIFTTNTSTLLPSQFAKETGRPTQFAALHFHPHTWISNVVDIMPHPGTSPETIRLIIEFARKIGQIPIVLQKETHGYVFNAMLSAINREAMTLVANGIASVEDVDRAWMGIMKTQIGPFGIMDGIGLDTVWDITEYWAKKLLVDRQLRKNADFVKQYVDKGRLGVKTGHGFYDYPNPAYLQPDFIQREKN